MLVEPLLLMSSLRDWQQTSKTCDTTIIDVGLSQHGQYFLSQDGKLESMVVGREKGDLIYLRYNVFTRLTPLDFRPSKYVPCAWAVSNCWNSLGPSQVACSPVMHRYSSRQH